MERTTSYGTFNLNSGLPSSQTDHNGLKRVYGWDNLGRPTSLQEFAGSVLLRETSTIYDDANRRVAVKADNLSPGDQQLVAVTEYDQLGRVRLTQQPESASQAVSDDTAGIKVQTRYGYTGTISYQIVSNPYRADKTSDAGGEATMGWTLTASNWRHALDNVAASNVTFLAGTTAPSPAAIPCPASGQSLGVPGHNVDQCHRESPRAVQIAAGRRNEKPRPWQQPEHFHGALIYSKRPQGPWRIILRSKRMLAIALVTLGATAVVILAQAPAPALRTGPGVQAPNDAKEAAVLATCKVPPPARGGGRGRAGAPGRGAAPAATGPKDYTVTEIPGVIAAGQKWKEVVEIEGNNADGIIATKDGGILLAQNDKSSISKLDKNGKLSVVYSGLNTSGSIAMNSKGALFVANRGLNPTIEELAPQKKVLANKYNGDPLDCLGGVLNDVVADSKGGVYFTGAGLHYADPKGVVATYGQNLQTNGIVLGPDEKTIYVTNAGTVAALDVQKDGSLTNQREFAKWEGGGGDGSTFDSAGRLYVTTPVGIQVISKEGKVLGVIPAAHDIISVTFSGPGKKTLYAVGREGGNQAPGNKAIILAMQMIAQGPKGRGK